MRNYVRQIQDASGALEPRQQSVEKGLFREIAQVNIRVFPGLPVEKGFLNTLPANQWLRIRHKTGPGTHSEGVRHRCSMKKFRTRLKCSGAPNPWPAP